MKIGLPIIAIIISVAGFAQPSVKLYGYSQLYIPGMVPQREIPGENGGKEVRTSFTTTNYYVYIRSSVLLQPQEIWIGGKWHAAARTLIKSTPIIGEEPQKKTLVPFTNLKVQQVELGDTLSNSLAITPTLQKMMTANDLIISYTWKGKKYYATKKKLIVLEPIHAQ